MSQPIDDNEIIPSRRPHTSLAVLLLAALLGCGSEDGAAEVPAEGAAEGVAAGADVARGPAGGALEPAQELARAALRLERAELHEKYLLALPEMGRSLEVTTWVNDAGGKETVAVDAERSEVVDLDGWKRAEAESLEQRCGKLDRPLCDDLAGQTASELVPVVIWLAHPETDLDRDLAQIAPEQWQKELQRAVDARRAVAERVGKRLDAQLGRAALERSQLAPVLAGRLTRDEIGRVTADVEVGQAMLGGREVIDDLAGSMALSHWTPAPETDGTGVAVGVLESSRPDDVSLLGPLDVRLPAAGSTAHARLVTAIIRNTSGVPGYANGSSVAIANRGAGDSDIADIDWVVGKLTKVNNQSWHYGNEATSATLSARDRYLDYVARNYGRFFATASANSDSAFVVHKGFNLVSVGAAYNDGNIEDGDPPASECAIPPTHVSTWRNPGGQELPHLVADGGCVSAAGTMNYGTSFAAPAVTGIAAGLAEVAPILGSWPEPLKAILLASPAENDVLSPDTCAWRWSRNAAGTCVMGDGRDGTGLVHGDRAVLIAQSPDTGAPQMHGFDHDLIGKSAFAAGNQLMIQKHYAKGPRSCGAGLMRMRVALAWDSDASCTGGSSASCSDNLDMDLDLRVYEMPGNTLIATSATTTNSYEHIDIPIRPQFGLCDPQGPDWSYRIEVSLANYPTVSASERTFYGLAWSIY